MSVAFALDTTPTPAMQQRTAQLQADKEALARIVQQAKKAQVTRQNAEIKNDEQELNGGNANVAASAAAPSTSASDTSDAANNNTNNGNGGSMPMIDNAQISDQAFSNVSHNLMPLSPNQIATLHYLFNQSQKAAGAEPGVPPKPTSSSLVVNLSPGATPPVIRLSEGYVTSLVFLDASGSPWPIAAYDLGDPSLFNIQWDHQGNTLMIQAMHRYTPGNLAVQLKGLDAPVMITLLPGQQDVDYRVDLRVPGLGPNAIPMMNGFPTGPNPILLNVLDGVPPDGSKELEISGRNAQLWSLGDRLYLRTRLTVLSPSWRSEMRSADGMNAYEMPRTPLILASDHGKIVRLYVKGM